MSDQVAHGLEPSQPALRFVEGQLGAGQLGLDPALLGASMVALDAQLAALELDRLPLRLGLLGRPQDRAQPDHALAAALERVLTVAEIGEAGPLVELALALAQATAGLGLALARVDQLGLGLGQLALASFAARLEFVGSTHQPATQLERTRLQQISEELSARAGLEPLAEHWPHYKSLIQQQLRALELRGRLVRRADELEPRRERCERELAEAKAELVDARKRKTQARSRLRKSERELDERASLADLRHRQHALERCRERVVGLRTIL
ncbi:MAG TPA: hypothetical protein VM869_19085, partial [Enhygromyxa sp.]|nr:hypothetical protein [Enhygromyxa sp.]